MIRLPIGHAPSFAAGAQRPQPIPLVVQMFWSDPEIGAPNLGVVPDLCCAPLQGHASGLEDIGPIGDLQTSAS